MRFKTKDLLVSVMPHREIDAELQAKLCIWGTRICIRPTYWCRWLTWQCRPCSFKISGCLPTIIDHCGFGNSCGAGGSACDPTNIPCGNSFWFIEDPADLVTLKDEMNGVLKQLAKLEKEGLPAELSSQSDMAAAEEALEGALKELRRQQKSKK